jgi:hypothetical protein
MCINNSQSTRGEGEEPMADTIDVRNLTDEQVEALEKLVKLFREQGKQTRENEAVQKEELKEKEKCTLAVWDSNVIGKLTREELYEDR